VGGERTNAERQRRYIARLKAKAEKSERLEAELAKLRAEAKREE
jgi:hypothetical protein